MAAVRRQGAGAAAARAGEVPDPIARLWGEARANLAWLRENVPELLAGTMRRDEDAIAGLAAGLSRLRRDRQLVLADRAHELVVARLDVPGSLFDTVRRLDDREIPHAEIAHSRDVVPGTEYRLELQRYRFERRSDAVVAQAGDPAIPAPVRRRIRDALAERGGAPAAARREALLRTLWINDRSFVELADPRQVARFLWLLHRSAEEDGFVLEVEDVEPGSRARGEARVLLAVESPPGRGFLTQLLEVLNGLDLGVRDCVSATVATGAGPCFLGAFRVAHRRRATLAPEAELAAALAAAEREIAAHNTGHRMLDEFRRSLFRVALAFVRHTLKTNFYVPEKRALAFRLDPAYLDAVDPAFTADLPRERPFPVRQRERPLHPEPPIQPGLPRGRDPLAGAVRETGVDPLPWSLRGFVG